MLSSLSTPLHPGDYLVTIEEKNNATYLRAYTNWRYQVHAASYMCIIFIKFFYKYFLTQCYDFYLNSIITLRSSEPGSGTKTYNSLYCSNVYHYRHKVTLKKTFLVLTGLRWVSGSLKTSCILILPSSGTLPTDTEDFIQLVMNHLTFNSRADLIIQNEVSQMLKLILRGAQTTLVCVSVKVHEHIKKKKKTGKLKKKLLTFSQKEFTCSCQYDNVSFSWLCLYEVLKLLSVFLILFLFKY